MKVNEGRKRSFFMNPVGIPRKTRQISGATPMWSNVAIHPSTKSTVSTKSIKPRPNPAQSSPIVPALLFRASTRSNPSLPPAQKSPFLQSFPVRPRQSQSKRFPIATFGPHYQPPPRYIAVPLAQCTTNGGFHYTPHRFSHAIHSPYAPSFRAEAFRRRKPSEGGFSIRNRMTFGHKKGQDAQIRISPLVPFAPFRGHPPNPQSAIPRQRSISGLHLAGEWLVFIALAL
jgi:hypothetical protein